MKIYRPYWTVPWARSIQRLVLKNKSRPLKNKTDWSVNKSAFLKHKVPFTKNKWLILKNNLLRVNQLPEVEK
ncbi:hypothetical protein [Mesobacillus foraminis]|uniref:hypothetical protein n=1 Tax=Mesobacillus foraminis TaxID=279826 RepID=UPI0013CEACFA|nr:hypothetical protein [Mesobacillus foraminis]